jgi:hypothetical protein
MAPPPLVSMMLEGLPVSVDALKTTLLASSTCTAAVVLSSTTLCTTNALLGAPPMPFKLTPTLLPVIADPSTKTWAFAVPATLTPFTVKFLMEHLRMKSFPGPDHIDPVQTRSHPLDIEPFKQDLVGRRWGVHDNAIRPASNSERI